MVVHFQRRYSPPHSLSSELQKERFGRFVPEPVEKSVTEAEHIIVLIDQDVPDRNAHSHLVTRDCHIATNIQTIKPPARPEGSSNIWSQTHHRDVVGVALRVNESRATGKASFQAFWKLQQRQSKVPSDGQEATRADSTLRSRSPHSGRFASRALTRGPRRNGDNATPTGKRA